MTEYFLRRAWDDGTFTVDECGHKSIEDAAKAVDDYDTGWIIQCFIMHTDSKNMVIAATDCTPALIEAAFDIWAGGTREHNPPQIILDIVEETFKPIGDGCWDVRS